MRLNPPTVFIFLISLVLAVLSIASTQGFITLPSLVTAQNYWLAIAAYIVLAIGNLVRGL